ncbi:MAG: Uma2 family endonuclease [Chloroflexi bacterium]|nr:Uma2 family endonuclease [Chloroflexota bacterium]
MTRRPSGHAVEPKPTGDQPARRRFTVDEYEQMIEAGILRDGERVELIEGEIVEMAAMSGVHAGGVTRANLWFSRRTGDDVLVQVQCPIRLTRSEPEPDIALLRAREGIYEPGLPIPTDVLLLLEIAVSSLAYDRRRKIPLYGREGIVEAWLVDLETRTIWVYRQPGPNGYGQARQYARDKVIVPVAFPDLTVPVSAIVG